MSSVGMTPRCAVPFIGRARIVAAMRLEEHFRRERDDGLFAQRHDAAIGDRLALAQTAIERERIAVVAPVTAGRSD